MDRFIDDLYNENPIEILPLKSNMDRFIADIRVENVRLQLCFKIQYG